MRGFSHTAAVLVIAASLLVGCESSGPARDLVADTTMIDVLIELHLAHARYETHDDLPVDARDSILVHYGVDSTAYVRTIAYYSQNPEKYGAIYSRVLDRMNVERLDPNEVELDPTAIESRRALERRRPR